LARLGEGHDQVGALLPATTAVNRAERLRSREKRKRGREKRGTTEEGSRQKERAHRVGFRPRGTRKSGGDARPREDMHAQVAAQIAERADKSRRCLGCSKICRGFGTGCLRLCLWSPESFPSFRNEGKRHPLHE
jgi:hypothetical protein